MADFSKQSAADMAADNPGLEMGTTGSMHDIQWDDEDLYWQGQYPSRPYALADRPYSTVRPAYQYGAQAATYYTGRPWPNVEADLARGWDKARGPSHLSWEDAKHPIRDAWDRVRGRK
jgi:hypothetical protein